MMYDSYLINGNKSCKQLLVVRQLDGDGIEDRAELDDPGDGQDQAAALLTSSQETDQVNARNLLQKIGIVLLENRCKLIRLR
jgi:hypothetical protein